MALPLSYNVRNVRVRWRTSFLAVLGMALVVAVFLALLAMSFGFRLALGSTGSPENAIVVQRGAPSELTSLIPLDQLDFVVVDPRVKRDAEGNPLASREMFVIANLPKRENRGPTNVAIRGVTPRVFGVRTSVAIEKGEKFKEGLPEVIVGKRIQERIEGLDLGGSIRIQRRDWKVVGIFGAGGSGFESEIWMDSKVLAQAFNRRELYQSCTLRLSDPSSLPAFAGEIERDPKLQLDLKGEREFYAEQAGPVANNMLILAIFVSSIMALGAVFGGMNTMYAIVAARTREIGTLRALGFSRGSILLSFLVESVFLALAGGGLGTVLALPANLLTAGTASASFSEIAFAFRVTPGAIAAGLALALLMGVLGGFLPAFRAARMPVSAALKEG
jgi:ABC-type lipoprotein release transport system permease subunit